MRYLALATDYDGTLAHHGRVSPETRAGLVRLRESGRKLIMVTGRELEELRTVCSDLELFDLVVAENGALIWRPSDGHEEVLDDPPPAELIEAIRRRGVDRLSVGRVILATWEPHETAVLEAIRERGLEYQVIFNKGAVMVLPTGITKATGMAAALVQMGLSRHNVVGVGDAENDHAFLHMCQCSVAVANAIDALKQRTDLVTRGDHGAGVVELIERMLVDDLASLEPRLTRQHVLLGTAADGTEVRIKPYGGALTIAAAAADARSALAGYWAQRLIKAAYQVCLVDPAGRHGRLTQLVAVGTQERPATTDEVIEVLHKPDTSASVNLAGAESAERAQMLVELVGRLEQMRAATGRPHCLLIDEADELLSGPAAEHRQLTAENLQTMAMVARRPESLPIRLLCASETIIASGDEAPETLRRVSQRLKLEPAPAARPPGPGEVLVWHPRTGAAPTTVKVAAIE